MAQIDWILFAILLNGIGSLLVVLPEFPLFRQYIATNKDIRLSKEIKNHILEPLPEIGENRIYISDRNWSEHLQNDANVEYVGNEEWFEKFVTIAEEYTNQTPSRISVFHDDGGNIGVRIFHKEPDDAPEGHAGRYQTEAPKRVTTWIENEIENQRTGIQLKYIRRGAVLLLTGFTIQFLFRVGILP